MREFPRDFTLIGSPQGNFEHCLLLLAHSLMGYFPRGSPVAMTLLMEWGSFPGKFLEPLRKLSRVGGFPGEAPCCHGATAVMREFPWEFLEPLRKLLIIAYYKRWSYPRGSPPWRKCTGSPGFIKHLYFPGKAPCHLMPMIICRYIPLGRITDLVLSLGFYSYLDTHI